MICMRKKLPEVGWDDFEILSQSDSAICMMRGASRSNSVPTALEVKAKAPGKHGDRLIYLLSDAHSDADGEGRQAGRQAGRHSILLEPCGHRWFRVGGPDQLLKRTEVSP